jgi:hypothetical protein
MGFISYMVLQTFRARLWLIVFILGCPITFLVLGAAVASMAGRGRKGGSQTNATKEQEYKAAQPLDLPVPLPPEYILKQSGKNTTITDMGQ